MTARLRYVGGCALSLRAVIDHAAFARLWAEMGDALGWLPRQSNNSQRVMRVAAAQLDGSNTTGVFVAGAWNREKIKRVVGGLSGELEGRTH